MNKINKENIKQLYTLFIEMETSKSVFARNLFKSSNRKGILSSKVFFECFSKDETMFLMLFFDCLHNFPCHINNLVSCMESDSPNLDFLSFVERDLRSLNILLTFKEKINYNSSKIRFWIHDLNKIQHCVESAIPLIKKLMEL